MNKVVLVIDLRHPDDDDTILTYMIPKGQIIAADSIVEKTRDEWMDGDPWHLCYDEFIEEKFRAAGIDFDQVDYYVSNIFME